MGEKDGRWGCGLIWLKYEVYIANKLAAHPRARSCPFIVYRTTHIPGLLSKYYHNGFTREFVYPNRVGMWQSFIRRPTLQDWHIHFSFFCNAIQKTKHGGGTMIERYLTERPVRWSLSIPAHPPRRIQI